MPALPRAPSCMTGSTYSPTTSLRPIATLIWQRMAPIDSTLTPGLKAIGPFLVEIRYVTPAGPGACYGGDIIFHACSPRATLYRAGTTHTTTNWLRPIPAIIWHHLAPIEGTLAPNPRVIGPLLVEIYFVMSASPGPPYTAPAEPTPPPK
jgi:hypothetical protein